MKHAALVAALILVAMLALSGTAHAGLITLTVISGITGWNGEDSIADTLLQESLSGTTLTQVRSPLLFDPDVTEPIPLTVRLTNTSDQTILFPEFLPGVSVLTAVNGIPGESAKTNVGSGGAAGKGGLWGAEGGLSRTALDLTMDLDVAGTPADSSHGGGGGAGTGVGDNLISISGASGSDLAAFLAGRALDPGAWVDIEGFALLRAFHRSLEDARIGFGLDFPTFSSGGISVTTAAWTGSFAGPAPVTPPAPGDVPPEVPEPATAVLLLGGLVAGALRRVRRLNGKSAENRSGE